MASNINPNAINTGYPVAGQDNSTQGFRTNFTAIKANFQFAEDEINALQDSAAVVDGNNDFGGNLINNVKMQDVAITKVTNSSAAGNITLNFGSGGYYSLVTAGSVNLVFSEWPTASSSSVGYLRLEIRVTDVTHTMTVSADASGGSLLVDVAGIQGYTAVNNYSGTITFAAVGTYEFEFVCSNGGTEITVHQTNQSLSPLNATSEDVADAAAISLATTTSFFATAAAETATLAAGVNGQVKVLAMTATLGDMVITVTNAGWKTSGTGTITFDTIGDACTLLYSNSKWYCIGNNGAVFA